MGFTLRDSEFLYILRLANGQTLLTHAVAEGIGIRAELDHVMTFAREARGVGGHLKSERIPHVFIGFPIESHLKSNGYLRLQLLFLNA
ncbi:hypothetical protein [Simplicispira psychrophila]|uniref:hypothetical protein n=1 Tax=Simplicispira psychrophila TaxID=80882 RepID=UPI00048064D4